MTVLLLQAILAAATIQGKVIVWDSTTPIAQVEVELRRVDDANAKPIVVVTNADGEFRFVNVPPGQYRLISMRPGFSQGEYRQRRPGSAGSPITVGSRQQITGVTLQMAPGGVIAGRILDKDGQPLARGAVQAFRLSYEDGKPTLKTIQSGITDDRGEYRLFWLPPGRYYVSFRPPNAAGMVNGQNVVVNPSAPDTTFGLVPLIRPRPQARNPRPAELNERETYVTTYFPSTADLQTATLMNLHAGEEIRDVNVTAIVGKTVAVRVSVLDPSTKETPLQLVLVRPLIGPPQPMNAQIGDLSNPVITYNLLPGAYELTVSTTPSKLGRGVVEVFDRDVNVTLVLTSATVAGRVRVENPPAGFNIAKHQVVVRAAPAFRAAGDISPDGTFRVDNVPAGDYEVVVSDSALLDTYQASLCKVHVSSQQQEPVEVTLNGNGGELDGTIVNDRQEGVSEATVVLISNTGGASKTVATDSAGRFQIRGIAPGEYSAYAWEDVDTGAWFDPNFISIFRDRATTIRVAAGEKLSLRLRSIRD